MTKDWKNAIAKSKGYAKFEVTNKLARTRAKRELKKVLKG